MKRHFVLLIGLVLIIGVAISMVAAWVVWQSERDEVLQEFANGVSDRAALLDRQISVNLEVLYSLKALFDTSEVVRREEFHIVAKDILSRHGDIQALEWIPQVKQAERDAYEFAARSDGYDEFQFTERASQGQMVRAGDRSVYFPVYFVESLKGNESAVGFDLASNAIRLEALSESRETGELRATASITLVQERGQQKGFLAFLPVYNGAPTSAAERSESLKGFVLGVFRIGDIFESATLVEHVSSRDAQLTLIDETPTTTDRILYQYGMANDREIAAELVFRKPLKEVAGRRWSLSVIPAADYLKARRSWQPLTILLSGVIFTAFLVTYLRLIAKQTTAVEHLVESRTVELREANKKLEQLSRLDGLTGLANRRVFEEELEREWARATRNSVPLSLLMIDVDCFKFYNDSCGHQAGDHCLKRVADRLRAVVRRPADLVARYGGEEFAILLPDTGRESATAIANDSRTEVEALGISHPQSTASAVVTISVGVSTLIPTAELTPFVLVANADNALYRAKEFGRNKVASDLEQCTVRYRGEMV